MRENPNKLIQFWQELKRRRVIHVIIVYATSAFVILELVNNVFEPLQLPDWTPALAIIILAIGFPLAIIFSWIFDVTPEGIEKTKSSNESPKGIKQATPNSWRIATYVCVVIIIGLVAFNIFSGNKNSKNLANLEKSIAVLPFYYFNADRESEDLGDAFANEITTQLYKIKGFDRIISPTSTLKYKGPDKLSVKDIGMELNANFIIEGSLERQNEEVSINIRIILAADDGLIWADKFPGKWKDIFTIRADIAKDVATELKTLLSPDEIEQIEKKPTVNPEAYDLYLLGNQYYSESTEDDLLKAIGLYENAIDLDPDFALAYIGMADSYMDLFWHANWLPEKAYQKAREATLRALEIDNLLAEAHTALGWIKLYYDWDIAEAEKAFLKAIDLNPNLASAYINYASLLNVSCRFAECHWRSAQALDLNPNSDGLHSYYGLTYFFIGQVDSAVHYLNQRIQVDSNSLSAHYLLGYIYLEVGEYHKAIRELQQAVMLDSVSQPYRLYLGIAYARAGLLNETKKQLEAFDEIEKESETVSFGRAVLLAELGEVDSALYWLNKAYEERYQHLLYLKPVQVMFEPIRSDPRFMEIYNKVWPEDD